MPALPKGYCKLTHWGIHVRRFKGIEWNLPKIEAHALGSDEVEASFDRVLSLNDRDNGSFRMYAETVDLR